MIYSDLIKKAMQIAVHAHQGQMDKGGYPYIFHPFHLAEQMEDEICMAVALLHDVVEDTAVTFSDLRRAGISEDVLVPLKFLTHEKGVPYKDYITQIKKNPVAQKVKIADLIHNSDLSRLATVTEKDRRRLEKYQKALQILMDEEKNCSLPNGKY